MARWMKWAGPGQFRGEGTWVNVDKPEEIAMDDDTWQYLVTTGFLPTHVGDKPPDEEGRGHPATP